MLLSLAREHDRESIVYAIDRVKGKPVQQQELSIGIGVSLSADKIRQALSDADSRSQALLTSGDTEAIDGEYTEAPAEVSTEPQIEAPTVVDTVAPVPDNVSYMPSYVAQYPLCDVAQVQTESKPLPKPKPVVVRDDTPGVQDAYPGRRVGEPVTDYQWRMICEDSRRDEV